MASVRKRTWSGQDGKLKIAFVVDYKDGAGGRRSKQFERKKDADSFRNKTARELEAGIHVAVADDLSIKQLCEMFLRNAEERRTDGRIGGSRLVGLRAGIAQSILPYWGKRKASTISHIEVENWYSWLRSERQMKASSARTRVEMFRLLECFAQRRGMMKAGAVAMAKRELGASARTKIRTFTMQDVMLLLQTATRNPPKAWRRRNSALVVCFINIAAFSGLRYGEIAALKIGNVDCDRRTLRVRHSLSLVDGIKGPKTKSGIRDVAMPAHVADLIKAYLSTYHVKNPDDLIFTTRTGAPMTLSNFHAYFWKPLQRQAGFLTDAEEKALARPFGPNTTFARETDVSSEKRRFHFHALRHFAASWMLETGFGLADVAAMLGHATFDQTLQTYAHSVISEARRHDLFDKMAAPFVEHAAFVQAAPAQQAQLTR